MSNERDGALEIGVRHMPETNQLAERSVRMQRSPEFQRLRRAFMSFIFPMTALFLAWYLAYVLIAGFAPNFFATPIGNTYINVGLLFGIAQFVTTFAITMLYGRWANRTYDPMAEPLAREMEEGGVMEAEAGEAQEGSK